MLMLKRIKKICNFLLNLRKFFILERESFRKTEEIGLLKEIISSLKIDKYNLVKFEKKIKVLFLTQEISLWPVFITLYNELRASPKFDVHIILTPKYFCGKLCREDYENLKNFFNDNSIPYIDGISNLSSQEHNYEILGLKELNPHFVFYTCPYMEDYHKNHQCDYVSLFTHICYIPYGFLLADQPETQYMQGIHHIAYKIFCETDYHKDNYRFNRQKGNNAIVTGYTKFDLIETLSGNADLEIVRNKFTKIIIFAPHWSIGSLSEKTRYGTFDKYFKFIQYLPKKYPDVFFIFKPHPSLKDALQRAGIFTCMEYDQFIANWSSYKNTMYYEGANYFEHFFISDGLITDSVSFLAEYVLSERPILLLKRPDATPYNQIGKQIEDNIYKAFNESEITDFIENILLLNNDYLKTNRISLLKTIKPFKEKACVKIRQELERILKE